MSPAREIPFDAPLPEPFAVSGVSEQLREARAELERLRSLSVKEAEVETDEELERCREIVRESNARAVELSFNDGWRFTKGDDPAIGTNLTLSAISQWSLPTANPFTTNAPLARPAHRAIRSPGRRTM